MALSKKRIRFRTLSLATSLNALKKNRDDLVQKWCQNALNLHLSLTNPKAKRVGDGLQSVYNSMRSLRSRRTLCVFCYWIENDIGTKIESPYLALKIDN